MNNGSMARLHDGLQYMDDMHAVVVGPVVGAHFVICFARFIGPAYVTGADGAPNTPATVERIVHALHGDRRLKEIADSGRARIVAVGHGVATPAGFVDVLVGRGTAFGNPFPVTAAATPDMVVVGFACAVASIGRADAANVGELLGLMVHEKQACTFHEQFESGLTSLVERLRGGEQLALRCPCNGVAEGTACHAVCLRDMVLQRSEIADEVGNGPPPDPVQQPPTPAFGLEAEAAKPSKWGADGSSIWIGKGLDANLLITWVPPHKAAHALLLIQSTLAGTCMVERYEHLIGFLEDLRAAIGWAVYVMKGMRALLQTGAEVDDGPAAAVALRKQMKGRLVQWRSMLLNCPGASMNLQAHKADPQPEAPLWQIGGDAASETDDQRAGPLGRFGTA